MVKTLKDKKRTFLGSINLAIIVLIILFGLWPFNFWLTNRVEWLKERDGLHFYGRGIAYTPIPVSFTPQPPPGFPSPLPSALYSFSVEIWLQPDSEPRDYTARILSLYDGQGTENLVLSQWRSGLVLQKAIQDRPEETYPKVGIRDVLLKGVRRFFTITSGPEGTAIYIDGRPAEKRTRFSLSLESGTRPGRLILGNSPRGKQPWHGNLYGLALFDRLLTKEQVLQHFETWKKRGASSLAKEEGIVALYPFDEHSGIRAHDLADGHGMIIPSRLAVLQKTVLVPPWKDFRLNRSYIEDVIVNILGFVPFGLFFPAYLRERRPRSARLLLLLSILTAGGISLSIELLQVYLPTRSSQLMDVITNMLGATIGTVLFAKSMRPKEARTHVSL